MVTIDTWRADHFNAELTPELWSVGGARFVDAWSPIGLTTPAHASLWTGLLPPEHGLRGNNHHGYSLAQDKVTVAEQLAEAGWATGAFVSAWPAGPELDQGFSTFSYPPSGRRPTEETLAEARAWLDPQEGPWLLWVHAYDPHGPYTASAQDLAAVGGGEDDRARYRAAVHQADRLLGPLYREALERGALLVVSSDHGEVLEEERCGWQHERSSSPVVLRVPLVVAGSGIPAGEDPSMVGLVDVANTLRRHAGLEAGPGLFEVEREAWVAESGLCDPECAAGCSPAGFRGKDRVVYGASGGLWRDRPGRGGLGDPSLAHWLDGYPLPDQEPEGFESEALRALGYTQ